jgi:uncharacterized protein YndB with AHSA1/START domain
MTSPTFTLTRHFDAPPAVVWRTWTEQELVGRWYGPGMETVMHRFDPVPVGLWLHEMKMGEQSVYQRIEFVEVEAPSKLVMLMSNSDADWTVIPSPMMPDWPKTLLTEVTFEDADGGTKLTLEWTPYEASDAANKMFEGAMDSLGQGWGKGMDMIEEIVAELQKT